MTFLMFVFGLVMRNKDSSVFLTIIIPLYNARRYISRCLDSLLNVGQEDIELIVVDDGSSDGSAGVVGEYCGKFQNVRLIEQANSGPSGARNTALRCASGKYIAFIDSDDYVDSAVFARQTELMRGEEFDIWVSDFRRVSDNGCVLDEVFQIEETEKPIRDSAYLAQFLGAKDCVWNVWRYVFSREFLMRNGLFFAEGYSIAEDLEFVVRALHACRSIAFFHEPYYFYRVNYGATLTRQFSEEKIRQRLEMYRRAMDMSGTRDTDRLIKTKLSREYILSLSAIYEMPKAERAGAVREYAAARALMSEAAGVYALAAKAVNVLGISASARVLYLMKLVKRFCRQAKTRSFDRGRK